MDEWITIVIRQLFIYLLPVMVSFSIVQIAECLWWHKQPPNPLFAISWRTAWLPLLTGIAFHRATIFALPQPVTKGVEAATVRTASHLLLTAAGFALYTASLHWQPPTGLPPLHHWWCKTFMFFNLCMVAIHLLPLPSLLMGEWLLSRDHQLISWLQEKFMRAPNWWICLLAASPLLDLTIGAWIVYSPYEQLSTWAFALK
ncbi:MAG: hypothetical protein Q9M13_08330 [Mariprofundales bacterium]|nr:hypothetical protein [Mariprofundales bacterium]